MIPLGGDDGARDEHGAGAPAEPADGEASPRGAAPLPFGETLLLWVVRALSLGERAERFVARAVGALTRRRALLAKVASRMRRWPEGSTLGGATVRLRKLRGRRGKRAETSPDRDDARPR